MGAKKKAEFEHVITNLKNLDTEDLEVGREKQTYFHGYWFSTSSTEVSVSCSQRVRAVKGCVDGAYASSRWENLRYSGYDAMGTLESPWLAGHSGTLYAYVYRRDVHEVKIGELKQQRLQLECELQQIGGRVYKLEAEVTKKRADWDRLSKQISLLSAVSADLKQAHISLDDYLSTRDLYVQPTTLSDKDLFDMYLKRKQSAIEKIVSTPQVKTATLGRCARI